MADDGHVTSTIRQWDRRHWGEGGQQFAWWCTEAPDAFVGTRPVYVEMEAELTAMVGPARPTGCWSSYLAERARPSCLGACRCPTPPCDLRPAEPGRQSSSGSCSASSPRRRNRAQDPVVLVLLGQAPRGVDVLGLGPALGAPLIGVLDRPLQASRLFEPPMASLLHDNSLAARSRPCDPAAGVARCWAAAVPHLPPDPASRRCDHCSASSAAATWRPPATIGRQLMDEPFDPQAMVARFRQRAEAVRAAGAAPGRGPRAPAVPPAGPDRLHGLRHGRRRRGHARRRHPHPAGGPAAPRRQPPAGPPPA